MCKRSSAINRHQSLGRETSRVIILSLSCLSDCEVVRFDVLASLRMHAVVPMMFVHLVKPSSLVSTRRKNCLVAPSCSSAIEFVRSMLPRMPPAEEDRSVFLRAVHQLREVSIRSCCFEGFRIRKTTLMHQDRLRRTCRAVAPGVRGWGAGRSGLGAAGP